MDSKMLHMCSQHDTLQQIFERFAEVIEGGKEGAEAGKEGGRERCFFNVWDFPGFFFLLFPTNSFPPPLPSSFRLSFRHWCV